MTHDLSGKVAPVTGASRGLGPAIARKLAACGARTAVNTFGSPGNARHVVEGVRRAGGTAEAFRADVRDEQEVAHLVAQVREHFGPVDVLVLNSTGRNPSSASRT
jgi:3-oxoacyl-[acyl-carrier protein] reductase